ncbi:MAG TPA: pilus assembly protein TadG-related protein [Beijerinckiaceae bacterium]
MQFHILQNERGGVLLYFALALPVLAGGVAATVEYATLTQRKAQLQTAADTAALTAAKELRLANTTTSRIQSVASSAAQTSAQAGRRAGATTTVNTTVLDGRSGVQVSLTETVPSVVGRLLSAPSTELAATATARVSGSSRLCMVGLNPKDSETISLNKQATLTATGCTVHSNSKAPDGIKAADQSLLKADRVCSAGGVKADKGANLSSKPIIDCPQIADPLAHLSPPSSGGCDHNKKEVKGGAVTTLAPGVYCGGLHITEKSQVTLSPGIYVIDGEKLKVEKGASMMGENVAFYLRGASATFEFAFDSTISLSAPKAGAMAGILFFDDRTSKFDSHKIFSNDARKLLGTIYLPNGVLNIDANKPIADQSAYTIVVARRVELYSGPNLVLNTDYGGTDVPVPQGVGPSPDNAVALTR